MLIRRAARALVPAAALVGLLTGLPACTGEPALTTVTNTIQTFDLAPIGTSGSENDSLSINVPRPSPGKDIVIKWMRFFVADATGRELDLDHDAIHLHHVVMMSSKARDSACPESGYPAIGGQRFAASGNEKSPIILPAGYGYHSRSTDSWRAIWHLMNMGPTRQAGVRLAYEVSYFEGTPSDTIRDTTPYYLDVAGCTSSDFDLPGGGAPGSVATKSATIPIPQSGKAVYTIGHLHDGGVDVSIADAAGQPRCTATAAYGGAPGHEHSGTPSPAMAGHITRISLCTQPFDVAAGQGWTVSARYAGDVAYKDVMGVIFTYLAVGG